MSVVLNFGGSADDALSEAAHNNFPGAGIRGFSLCTTPIEIIDPNDSNRVFSRGTGFFYKAVCGQAYLVTCWHVVSGRDFFSRKCISATGFEPEELVFYGSNNPEKLGSIRQRDIRIKFSEELKNYIRSGPPIVAGVPVDLFAIPVDSKFIFSIQQAMASGITDPNLSAFINQHRQSYLETNAGDTCFVLGYPLKNYVGFRPPIWKRASIASDTALPVDGRPIFFVDGNTLPGLSGAPIIRMERVLIETEKQSYKYESLETSLFVGVYAGRHTGPDYSDTSLGYGWYGGLIPELVEKSAIAIRQITTTIGEDYDYSWQQWTNDPYFSADQVLLASFQREPNGSWTLVSECELKGPCGGILKLKPVSIASFGEVEIWGQDLFIYLNQAMERENKRRECAAKTIQKS